MAGKFSKYFIVVMAYIIVPYFIDQIDGFVNLVLNKEIPIAKLYKTPLLLYAIGYTFFFDKTKRYSMMLLIYLFLFIASTLVNIHDQFSDLGTISTDLGYLLKIFTFPILYFYFAVFHSNNPFPDEPFIKKLFLFIFFAFAVAILFSFFGFGISFYGETEEGESIGQQGYFSAGNEIGGLLILLASLFYFYLFRSKSIVYMFTGFGLSVGIGLLMGSKTAIGTTIICFLGVFFFMKNYDKKTRVVNKLDASLILTFAGMILLGIVFISQIADIIQPVIRHFIYRYKVSGDLLRFLTSGRLYRAEVVLDTYANHFTFSHMLFGEGYTFSKTLKIPNVRYNKAEMDFPDILFISGIVGVTLIYFFWLYAWVKVYNFYRYRKNDLAIPLLTALSILIVNSNISGHIIYSSIVNPSLAYLTVYVLKNNKIRGPDSQLE